MLHKFLMGNTNYMKLSDIDKRASMIVGNLVITQAFVITGLLSGIVIKQVIDEDHKKHCKCYSH